MTERSVSHADFTIERRFEASPARVFNAWADEQAHRRWFVEGDGWKIGEYRHDFRVGGRESSRFEFANKDTPIGDSAFNNETCYFDIVENERIVFAYSMARNGVVFSTSLVTVELTASGKSTVLKFTEQAAFFEGADGAEMRQQGWTQLLNALEKELAR